MKRIILIVLIIFIFVGCNKEKIYNEWVTKNDNKYYYDSNGTIVKNRTIEINGEKYHFDTSGKMVTGIVEENGNKYLFYKDGKMVHDKSIMVEGKNYYYDSEGIPHECKGIWEKENILDEFGDKTKRTYIVNENPIYGVFSNSVTTDSKCTFRLLYGDLAGMYNNEVNGKDFNCFWLMIYEYGTYLVKDDEDIEYDCKLRADNGYEEVFTGELWDDMIFFDYKGQDAILSCFKNNQKFKLRVVERSRSRIDSDYLFEVEPDNFMYIYNTKIKNDG